MTTNKHQQCEKQRNGKVRDHRSDHAKVVGITLVVDMRETYFCTFAFVHEFLELA